MYSLNISLLLLLAVHCGSLCSLWLKDAPVIGDIYYDSIHVSRILTICNSSTIENIKQPLSAIYQFFNTYEILGVNQKIVIYKFTCYTRCPI